MKINVHLNLPGACITMDLTVWGYWLEFQLSHTCMYVNVKIYMHAVLSQEHAHIFILAYGCFQAKFRKCLKCRMNTFCVRNMRDGNWERSRRHLEKWVIQIQWKQTESRIKQASDEQIDFLRWWGQSCNTSYESLNFTCCHKQCSSGVSYYKSSLNQATQ